VKGVYFLYHLVRIILFQMFLFRSVLGQIGWRILILKRPVWLEAAAETFSRSSIIRSHRLKLSSLFIGQWKRSLITLSSTIYLISTLFGAWLILLMFLILQTGAFFMKTRFLSVLAGWNPLKTKVKLTWCS